MDGTEGAVTHMPELATDLAPAPAITFLFGWGIKWVAERKVRHQAAAVSNMMGSRIGACMG